MRSDLKLQILQRVRHHRKEDPISGAALANEFGVKWRTIARSIEILRDNRYKIGSSNQEPPGYFMARDPIEMLETADRLRSQARKILARTNRLMDFGSAQPTVFEGPVDAG